MPIIYYDGNCIYCYNYAIWLIQNGLSKSYEFATIKGEIGEQFFNQHPEAKNRNSVILQKGEHLEYKSDAIATLITSLPNNKKWLGIGLRVLPKPIRDLSYNLFANNRDKMWKTHWHKPTEY
ncbi:thiol-disulfide oxidoreductase DCC family protein, partial [Rhizobium aegyptiacum]